MGVLFRGSIHISPGRFTSPEKKFDTCIFLEGRLEWYHSGDRSISPRVDLPPQKKKFDVFIFLEGRLELYHSGDRSVSPRVDLPPQKKNLIRASFWKVDWSCTILGIDPYLPG